MSRRPNAKVMVDTDPWIRWFFVLKETRWCSFWLARLKVSLCYSNRLGFGFGAVVLGVLLCFLAGSTVCFPLGIISTVRMHW